jgi:hypothetical protein
MVSATEPLLREGVASFEQSLQEFLQVLREKARATV